MGNGTGGICNVFDGEDYQLLKHLLLGGDADNVRYNPHAQRITWSMRIVSWPSSTRRTIPSARRSRLPETLGAFKVESSRPRMYVNAKAAGLVVVIDAEAGHVINQFPVAPASVNASLAIDEENRRLFVGCRLEPSIVVMDSETGKIVASVPIPGGVDDLWYDGGRKKIYASCGDGAIAVVGQVDADHYEPLATIPTIKGVRTSFFDTEAGRLYLGVPRRDERPDQDDPEIWVYAARP